MGIYFDHCNTEKRMKGKPFYAYFIPYLQQVLSIYKTFMKPFILFANIRKEIKKPFHCYKRPF